MNKIRSAQMRFYAMIKIRLLLVSNLIASVPFPIAGWFSSIDPTNAARFSSSAAERAVVAPLWFVALVVITATAAIFGYLQMLLRSYETT